jgi:hypothetical protein
MLKKKYNGVRHRLVNSVAFRIRFMRCFKKIITVLLCLLAVAGLCACDKENETPKEELKDNVTVITEEVKVEQVTDFEAKESPKSQLDVTVDDWLKIISIGEKEGVLSVFVRNISDENIEYAMLSVMTGDGRAEFPITTLTAGANATLRCKNGYTFKEGAVYNNWEIENKTVFSVELTCYPEVFEINGTDGFISIKNISDEDVEGRIYIYYKNVTDGVYDDGVTYRAFVDGLKKGETTQAQTMHYHKDSSRILYVSYGE